MCSLIASCFIFLILAISQAMTSPQMQMYCPVQNDFTYGGNIQWIGSGWIMTGSGGVHGKTSFNLLGGYVEFDMNTTYAHTGINNNFYTSSPSTCCAYCDIQPGNHPQCMEMDIIENNGNCLAQTTWHTWPNKNGDCDENGCWGQMYHPASTFHVRAEFSTDGWMVVTLNGARVWVTNPVPSNNAKQYVMDTMQKLGAMFHSTQWQGWVPGGNCGGSGDLNSSVFSVENLRVYGSVVQGQVPASC
eukprot:TRINITY_DN1226_c0_g1_i1.p1 TRINITY_DN1226_c0_g1~~TRINITY_DN1226_c0_g1_i1.p1  ORF type:complete len:245 (-),score=37.82 TRINITY_DN1226_c0_g1_i1:115-849(-)